VSDDTSLPSGDEPPTQQLRRTPPPVPMPEPLNPASPRRPGSQGTEVLSLDELMDRASAPAAEEPAPVLEVTETIVAVTAVSPPRVAPITPSAAPLAPTSADEAVGWPPEDTARSTAPRPAPAARPTMPVVPVRSDPASPVRPVVRNQQGLRNGPGVRSQLRVDASAALAGAGRRTQEWLTAGDHALVVATALIAILLLVAVAAV
jgi:hypothetical protein